MVWDTRKVEETKAKVEAVVDAATTTLSFEDVKAQGVSMRFGNKVVKFQVTEEVEIPEDALRTEMAKKATEKLLAIKAALNERMSELTYMVEQSKAEFEEKERKLQERLAAANVMPDINYAHAQKGLSVVRGNKDHGASTKDCLTWFFQGVYWPKFYDRKPIDPKYAKRLISPVTLEICTVGDSIRHIKVRKPIGLGKFEHYHGHNDDRDCWGNWRMPTKWKTPDDIIKVATDAMAVLENVNPMSPANQNPNGLPRMSTLGEHLVSRDTVRSATAGTPSEEATSNGWSSGF